MPASGTLYDTDEVYEAAFKMDWKVAADDEEIAGEEAMDEYAEYFGGNGAQRRTQSSPLARAVAWSSDATMLLLLQLRRR